MASTSGVSLASTSSLDEKNAIAPTAQDGDPSHEPVTSETEAHIMPDVEEPPEGDLEEAREKEVQEGKPAMPSPFDPSSFPDGGLDAWLTVLGGFCCLFCSFGWINCVFQEYYQQNQLKAYSPSTIAWIPSMETFMMFFGGPIIGKVYDNYGPRYLLLFGTFFHVFGLMMTSISTEYYQFFLAQGVCSPLGASAIFYPAMSTVSTWFFKRRALAFGIMASGSSLGGVIFPIMVERLVTEVGFGWTMRISAFLILALMITANLTVKSRLPPQPKPLNIMDFITPLTETPFRIVAIASFLFFFGIFLPFDYVILQAQANGMSTNLSGYLLAILNALSIFGRILPGYLADRYGRFNVMIIMSYFSAIIVLAIWLPSRSNAPIIVFAALYGFGSGAFVSMTPAIIAQISDIRKIGVRNGTLFALISVGALTGNPIGGALISHDHGGFTGLQIFSGVTLAAGSTMFLVARVYSALGATLLTITPFALCLSPSDIPSDTPISSLVSSANANLAQGNLNDALTYFDVAITRDPQNYLTIFKRGATYLSLGKNIQASQDFDRVLMIRPDFENALLQRAKIKTKNADWAAAQKDYEAAGKKGGLEIAELEEAQGAAALAADAEKARDWESCVSQAGVAIMTASTALGLRQLRARCRFERGEVHEGISDLAHVLQISPGSIEPHLQMSSMMFYSLGDTERGLTQIRKCLHSDPDSKSCSKLFRREKVLNKELTKVKDLMEKRQFNGASKLLVGTGEDVGLIQDVRDDLKEFKEAGTIYKNSPEELLSHLLEMTCEAYTEMNNPKKAHPYCTETLLLNPNSLPALLSKAQRQLDDDSFEPAISTLNHAKEHHPSSTKVQSLLQNAHTLLKRSKQKDYYKTLGLPRDADDRSIKRAYRSLTKQHHPDKAMKSGVSKDDAEKKMATINEAYEVLSDPELKARFDRGDDPNSQEQQGAPFQGSPFGQGPGGQQFFFRSGPGSGGGGGGQFKFNFP
ncbi:MAG: hypothetical protein M1827_000045 [Pycnora praestabilis]|nr:MAG: hypothetical protein M1827_000045 [Pycnora praestabilis]